MTETRYSQRSTKTNGGEGRFSVFLCDERTQAQPLLCVRVLYVFVFTHNKADDLKPRIETFVLVNYKVMSYNRLGHIHFRNNVREKMKKIK